MSADDWLLAHSDGFGRLLVPVVLARTGGHRLAVDLKNGDLRGAPVEALDDFDGRLRGWSWVEGTASWVVPTAMACLSLAALGGAGLAEGHALLRDRRCADGGWNYGNPRALGAELPSQPGPTAWALLALPEGVDEALGAAVDQPMGTGTLALVVLAAAGAGRDPEPWGARLRERLDQRGPPERYDHLALVVLALDRLAGAPCALTGRP